jgi:N6-adenosine-specific RNA methylase IME4
MVTFPNKKYKIIYADPPWVYRDKSKSHGGGAESHYNCIPIDEMCTWKIPFDKDSILFMWCTYPHLFNGLKLMKAWRFTYKTVAFTWIKTYRNGNLIMGMGHYTRANAEICLLGVHGKGIKRIANNIYNTQIHKRQKHSKKPGIFRTEIVKLCGDLPRIELFARIEKNLLIPDKTYSGWDVWGNEC